jgi:ATP-dependent RNA helicase DDX27
MEEDDDNGAVNAAIRSAKKAARPTKIGIPEARPTKVKKKVKPSKNRATTNRKSGGFDQDMGQRMKTEGARAKKGDAVGRIGKKKGKKTR